MVVTQSVTLSDAVVHDVLCAEVSHAHHISGHGIEADFVQMDE